MSFLKKLLGGTSKSSDDSIETMKRQQQAAIEVLWLFQEHLPTTFESHPATALMSAAWLAATSLHRSMGYPQDIEPGTVVISETVDPKWPNMIYLYLSVLEKDGIKLNRDEMVENIRAFEIPPEYQPKIDLFQVQTLFQDQYNQIMRKHGFDYEGGAQVGVFACAIMTVYHCITNKDLEPKLAAEIVSHGFFVGDITAPVPLKRMENQSEGPIEFFDLQGQPTVVSFLAMEYYAMMFNRSFAVMVTKNAICGAKMFGVVGSPRTAIGVYLWRDPRNFINKKTLEKYHSIESESPAFLKIDKVNFQIPCNSVKGIGYTSKKKMSMGGVPHSGSLFVYLVDGRKREFILLGNQDGEEIERLMLSTCHSASKVSI